VGSLLNYSKISFFQKNIDSNIEWIDFLKIKIKDESDLSKFEIDREGLYFTRKSNANEFAKSSDLHIHHKCYRKNLEIWSQPNDEYITLCNVCHRIVHETQLIPFYNENGDILQYMTPCWKCSGQRYLYCYRHIDGGICYACNGRGYEISS
jgi:hypothetical protein